MRYIILSLLVSVCAYAEPVYVCESAFIPYQLQHKAFCPTDTESAVKREYQKYIAWFMRRDFHAYPRHGAQTLRAAILEAQRATRCEWKELRPVCTNVSCQGGSSSSNGGELP